MESHPGGHQASGSAESLSVARSEEEGTRNKRGFLLDMFRGWYFTDLVEQRLDEDSGAKYAQALEEKAIVPPQIQKFNKLNFSYIE